MIFGEECTFYLCKLILTPSDNARSGEDLFLLLFTDYAIYRKPNLLFRCQKAHNVVIHQSLKPTRNKAGLVL